MNLKTLQNRGAEARAHGAALLDNPFYQTKYMPAITGDTIDVWQKQADAWAFGWQMEDEMRASGNAAAIHARAPT